MHRLLTSGVFVLAVIFAVPNLVLAHATPITYTPDAGTTELSVPETISIRFTERIEQGASSITIFAPDGSEAQTGGAYQPDAADPRLYSVDLSDRGEGVYTISWQVVSVDDGHFTKGAYSFLVDASGAAFEGDAGGIEVTYVTRIPEATFSFASLLGESIFLAGVLFSLLLVRPLTTRFNLDTVRSGFNKHLSNLYIVGFIFLVFGGITTIIRKIQELAILRGDSFADTMPLYLLSSGGFQTILKLGLGLVFILVYIVLRRHILASKGVHYADVILGIVVTGILFLQSNLSHAAASFFQPELSIVITGIHLFAKELIIGSILVLLLFLYELRKENELRYVKETLARYNVLAALGIGLGATSGVYITWLHLKDLENLLLTEWGTRFLVLLLFGLVFGAVRLFNQFVLTNKDHRSGNAWGLTKTGLLLELGVGMVVLFLSGYISITTPPFIVEQYGYQDSFTSNETRVIFEAHPYENDQFRVVTRDAISGAIVPVNQLILTATNEEKGIGPNILTVEDRAPGSYAVSVSSFAPPGNWDLGVVVRRNGLYDARGTISLTYPEAIEATRIQDEIRTFDAFTRMMLVVGVILTIVAILYFLLSVRMVPRSELHEDTNDTPDHFPVVFVTPVLFIAILMVVWGVFEFGLKSDFRSMCEAEGNEWRQAFPTRNFEVVSPNSLSGCWTHDGHYHFIDKAEYRYFIDNL